MTTPFQWVITVQGRIYNNHCQSDPVFFNHLCVPAELPETFKEAAEVAYDHCREEEGIRVLRLDHDTGSFIDQTSEIVHYIAHNLVDRRDVEEHGIPNWVEDAYKDVDIVIEGDV